VTAVKDQALCAGCSAFGATASLETRAMWALQTPEPPLDLSEQHLFSCSGGDCQSGANMSFAMIYLRQHGTPDEACFPYQAQNGDNIPCDQTCADWESRAYRIRSWNYVFHLGDFDRIKEALLEGPLYTYILIYEDFFAYAGGVYEHVWGNPAGGHGVSIIGWDDAEECWIGKNSWTDGWGEGGFFRIRWGEAEIETYMGRMVFDPADAPDDDDDDTSPADDDDDDDNDDDNDSDGDDDDNDGQDDDDDDNHDNAGCN
jgi:C1A family cysteine protease